VATALLGILVEVDCIASVEEHRGKHLPGGWVLILGKDEGSSNLLADTATGGAA
jgi:hypothetical protein